MAMSCMLRCAPAAKAANPFAMGRCALRSCAGLSDVGRMKKVWNIEYISEPPAMNPVVPSSQPTEAQLPQSASAAQAETPNHSDGASRWSYTVAHGFQIDGAALQQTHPKFAE